MRRGAVLLLFLAGLRAPAAVERQSGKILGRGTEKPVITLTAPKGGWTASQMVLVAGTVSDATVNPVTVSINGDRYLLKTVNGAFQRKFPVTAGKNAIRVQATNRAGLGFAERSVFAQTAAMGIFLVLTSDTDGVYTDLHVYEPPTDAKDPLASATFGAHVFWAGVTSRSGGKFYLNEQTGGEFDSPGFGPYLYTHASPPAGIYRVDANYWPSGDKAHTLGTLNVVLFGGTAAEVRRRVQHPLVMPGETATLAWLRVDKGQKAYVWSPVADLKPVDNKIWPAWVLDARPRRPQGGDSYGGEGM